jgi:hypothetical protein
MMSPFRTTLRKPKVIVTILLLLLVYWLTEPWPFATARGRFSAKVDLALGNYRLLAVGLPAPWSAEYARLLKSKYGVQYRQVALCIVSTSEVEYVRAYDAVSASAANARHNRDIFTECYEEAKKSWEQKKEPAARRKTISELESPCIEWQRRLISLLRELCVLPQCPLC